MFLSLILTNEGHEAFIVGGLAELLHQGLGLLLGQLLSEVGQQSEQLVGKHGVVVVLVVQLQDLNEVVEASLVLGVLAGLVHGEDIGLGEELLALGDSTADLLDGLQGGVQVAGADEVANVEGVDLAVSLEVIDVKGEVDGWKASDLGVWPALEGKALLGRERRERCPQSTCLDTGGRSGGAGGYNYIRASTEQAKEKVHA